MPIANLGWFVSHYSGREEGGEVGERGGGTYIALSKNMTTPAERKKAPIVTGGISGHVVELVRRCAQLAPFPFMRLFNFPLPELSIFTSGVDGIGN